MNYMHNNPVKKRLVSSPDQWPWSSFRFYYLNDSSVLTMDRPAPACPLCQLQFITTSTYRRRPLFFSAQLRHCFMQSSLLAKPAALTSLSPRLQGKSRGPRRRTRYACFASPLVEISAGARQSTHQVVYTCKVGGGAAGTCPLLNFPEENPCVESES